VNVDHTRAKGPQRLPHGEGIVAAAEPESRGEGRRPGELVLAGAGSVQDPEGMAAPPEFSGGDVGIGFRAGERAKALVDVKDLHGLPAFGFIVRWCLIRPQT